jgi:hypothetical protein
VLAVRLPSTQLTAAKAKKAITRPTMAYRIVFLAEVTWLLSPLETVYLIPPIISMITLMAPMINSNTLTIVVKIEPVPNRSVFAPAGVAQPTPLLMLGLVGSHVAAADTGTAIGENRLSPSASAGSTSNPASTVLIVLAILFYFLS